MPTTKSTPFVVSKDEWDTKEDPGKSMKNALQWRSQGVARGDICPPPPPSQISVLTQLSLALNNFFCQRVPTPRYARVLKLTLFHWV